MLDGEVQTGFACTHPAAALYASYDPLILSHPATFKTSNFIPAIRDGTSLLCIFDAPPTVIMEDAKVRKVARRPIAKPTSKPVAGRTLPAAKAEKPAAKPLRAKNWIYWLVDMAARSVLRPAPDHILFRSCR